MDFTKLSFIFKGSSFINDSFIDDEKYKILAKLAALWIRRVQTFLVQEEQNNIFARFSAQQQNNDNLPTGSRNLVPTSNNNIPYQDGTQHLTNDITDKITGPNVDNSKDSRHPDTTSYQSRDNNKETTEIVPLNKKKRKSKNKELQPLNSTDVNFVQQQYNDKEELDLEKHNSKVSSKIPTNYGKNRNQNTHVSDMEDIIAIPVLDFNNQSEILIDISTVQNNIDMPSSYVFPSSLSSKGSEEVDNILELWLINQDVIMTEAEDNIMDNSISNYKEEMDLKDQDASKAASSIQEFESAIKTKADNQKCTEIDDKTDHNWYPPSKIKKPKKVLTDIKKHSTRNQTSMHTFIEKKVATYDAYIPINDINFYDSFDDKFAFIELNVRNFSDYAGVEYNATDKHIIIKNYAIGGMRRMVRLFNHFFKDSNLKMKEKKYYTLHGQRISSREFKILEIPNNIDRTSIESSIRRLLHARQLLKNVWSIDIENYIYRLGPAHFKASDFDERKKHRGEFIGFGKEHTAAKALEITAPFNPKSAFKQRPDKIIVEFQNEADLFNACDKNYHFSDFNIKGNPLGYNWPQRERAIKTAANHDDDSKEKVNNKPHIQGQNITLGRHTHRNQRFKNNQNSKNHNITKKNLDNIPYCASGSNKIPLGLKSHCSMNNNKDNIIISDNTSSDTSSTNSNTPNNQNRQGDWDEYRNHNYITQAQNNGKSHEDSIQDKINNNSTREYPNAYNKKNTPEQQHLQDINDQVMQDINELLNMKRNRFINEQQNQLQKAKFPTISFATYNINGLKSNPDKLYSLIDDLKDFDIIGLNETNISPKDGKYINNELNEVQVYMPTNDAQEKVEVAKFITDQINEYKNNNNNNYLIIAGDLNAIVNKHQDKIHVTKQWNNNRIFNTLLDNDIIDTYREDNTNKKEFTWSNGSNSTRIDYIWLSPNWTNELIHSSIKDAKAVTNNDQNIVTCIYNTSDIIRNYKAFTCARNNNERLIFDYASMDNDKWQGYTTKTDDEHVIKDILLKAAKSKIPNKKIKVGKNMARSTDTTYINKHNPEFKIIEVPTIWNQTWALHIKSAWNQTMELIKKYRTKAQNQQIEDYINKRAAMIKNN
ncbi:hypothetical protein GLOIN_2v1785965 [Rhizophagus irregularis DAOM 181602=DAOM 197198]|uniref:Endonuclease/exonuclease/phosphatase domain-containing protein n=1 Tax=Rhizophagus irregularis (strain DAOM 181602 / DAOM 197198 / MUCL 43194) TaxID=747089 RepID=A0A2P4P970_RHIID|nr:hypothetical protein GLOIN_2v1785965 [Rhizophagus irregularis DAOM 181602=DAOM 197198]POG61924.1 hypothetical protein GLOIN_2v1785965 [Rhizophagus irregularis DAOM 181602=DAOM 197198]|eukprot:XP_025168790.1 hypothetical protein GLOIN_2v1785965 [Rhizophagus irregularis DAOM 181602=DAOM 197198]